MDEQTRDQKWSNMKLFDDCSHKVGLLAVELSSQLSGAAQLRDSRRHLKTDMMNRAWILTGYMRSVITKEQTVAVEFIGRALQVLKWGHEMWRDASLEDKGVIFIDSFVQGVHALYIEAYSEVRTLPPCMTFPHDDTWSRHERRTLGSTSWRHYRGRHKHSLTARSPPTQ